MNANESLFARAYRQVIDDARLNEKLLTLLAGGEGFVMKRSNYGTATLRAFHHLDDDDSINPIGRPPATPLASCLEAPFDNGGLHTEDTLLSLTVAGFNENGGSTFSAVNAAEAGAGAARAAVGSFITVSPGYSKLKVSAQMRCDFEVSAQSIAGVTYASVDTMLELFDIGGDTEISAVENVSSVLAPVGWSALNEGVDTVFINATFLIPTSGGEFLVRAGGKAGGWGGGVLAYARANIRTFRTEICVEAEI
jgi:hypothetical protein